MENAAAPQTLSEFMTQDHRSCDASLTDVENAVSAERWADAASAFTCFHDALVAHLAREEEVLFPALEMAMGGPMGPTQVMRMEHRQMHQLVSALEASIGARDRAAFLSASDTLLVLIQQHNMKEERILYPMLDRALGGRTGALLDELRARRR